MSEQWNPFDSAAITAKRHRRDRNGTGASGGGKAFKTARAKANAQGIHDRDSFSQALMIALARKPKDEPESMVTYDDIPF